MPAGRPKQEYPREQIDRAKWLLGRRYPSVAAAALMKSFGLSRSAAYRLIDAARADVYDSLRGNNAEPLTVLCSYYLGIVLNPKERTCDRTQAANGLKQLLGLNRVAELLGAAAGDETLAQIAARLLSAGVVPGGGGP